MRTSGISLPSSGLQRAGVSAGLLRDDPDRYLAQGFTMVAVGSDLGLLARGSDALVASFNP